MIRLTASERVDLGAYALERAVYLRRVAHAYPEHADTEARLAGAARWAEIAKALAGDGGVTT